MTSLSLEQGSLEDRLIATRFLLERAHDLSTIARDESAPDEVRIEAALYARAIRQEIDLPLR